MMCFFDPRRKDAKAALKQSQRQLKFVKSQEEEVQKVVKALRDEAERNHFIERLNLHLTRKA